MHKSCYVTLSSQSSLEKAIKRKEKAESSRNPEPEPEQDEDDDDEIPSPKRLRSSMGGPLYDKTKCVWCMKVEDIKHPNRRSGRLLRISTKSAWQNFKRHPVLIDEDSQLRTRLSRLIESTTDPIANDIMYNHSCWQKYINHRECQLESVIRLQLIQTPLLCNVSTRSLLLVMPCTFTPS